MCPVVGQEQLWDSLSEVDKVVALVTYAGCHVHCFVHADPKDDDFLEFDGRKVVIPKGKPIPMTPYKGSHFYQSEYLVYKESQVRIRYLLTFKR